MTGVFTAGKLKLMAKHIAKVGKNFEAHLATVADKAGSFMKKLGSFHLNVKLCKCLEKSLFFLTSIKYNDNTLI